MVGNANGKKYTMIVFEEDERYGSNGIGLDFYSDNPAEGLLSDIVQGDNLFELMYSSDGVDNEGLFYMLYDNATGKRIGSGMVDFDAIEEEVNMAEGRQYAVSPVGNSDNDLMDWFYSYGQAARYAKLEAENNHQPLYISEVVNGDFGDHNVEVTYEDGDVVISGRLDMQRKMKGD